MKSFLASLVAILLPALASASPISDVRQLTFEGKRAGEGYFSADGRKMVFQSEREAGNPFYQMYTLDLETGDVDRVSTGIGKTTCGWLHPSGDQVLFASTQFDPEAEAKMAAELEFRASGQTRRYAWDYDPTYDLVAQDLGSGAYTRLTTEKGYDAEGAYSPDGSRIVFASNRHAYASELTAEEAARLEKDPSYFMEVYVMNADGTDVRRLTDMPGYDGGTFWSADGSRITWRRFSEDGSRAEVFTMKADGSDVRQLTDLGVLSWAPYFHPSGAYLIFATNLQGFSNFELYIVPSDGAREPVRVTERDGFDGLPTFTPDGKTLSWTSNATAGGGSQIFLGSWDHDAALALLADAPIRDAAVSPAAGTRPGIEIADLRRHVEALASEEFAGRLTGTEGERLATAYVADAFAAIGIEPAGEDGGFFQPFEFTAGVALEEGNTLSLSIDGKAEDLVLGDSWTPLAFSRGGEAPSAPVAFAGYGLSAPETGGRAAIDSYGGLDLDGKWVLIWRGLPAGLTAKDRVALWRFADMRYKASVAKSKGAAGVIFAPPPDGGGIAGLPKMRYDTMSTSTSLPVVAVTASIADRMLSILGAGRADMTAQIEAGEAVSSDLIGVSAATNVALKFERKLGRNVLGRLDLDGIDDARPPLYIGAHVDHLGTGETSGSLATSNESGQIHYGADDNASGVAALIEIAQKLATDHAAGKLTGTRDVVFAAWSGEELGLLGVNHFTEDMMDEAGTDDLAEAVSAYINMDMIGRLRDNLVVSGLGSSEIWAREIERRNAVIGLPIVTSQNTYLPTDATAFYIARVPILSLFTGAHPDYHTPRDTPELLNYEGLKDIARFAALVARSRILEPEEPGYLEVARPERQGNRRVGGVFLGTIPDYAQDGVTGVAISGVVKNGPAEKAGLAGQDVIVGIAGQELEDIYDFVRAMNGLKPGEAVDISVMRDGARQTFEIVPAVRN